MKFSLLTLLVAVLERVTTVAAWSPLPTSSSTTTTPWTTTKTVEITTVPEMPTTTTTTTPTTTTTSTTEPMPIPTIAPTTTMSATTTTETTTTITPTTTTKTTTTTATTVTTTTRTISGPRCSSKAEVFLVYDVSSSFQTDFVTIHNIAGKLVTSLFGYFSDTRAGIGSFSDKQSLAPDEDFGDYCYKTDMKLTRDKRALIQKLYGLSAKWGFDLPESQLDALFHAVKSKTVDWSPGTHDGNGVPITKILILATDADFHTAGFMLKTKAKGFVTHPGLPEPKCEKYDYPSVAQVKDAFQSNQVLPIVLARGKSTQTIYRKLLDEIGMGGAVVSLDERSLNVIGALSEAVQAACNPLTTTTTPTTTTTTTTTAAITQTRPETTRPEKMRPETTRTAAMSVTTTHTATTNGGGFVPQTEPPPNKKAINMTVAIAAAVSGAVAVMAIAAAAVGWYHMGNNSSPVQPDVEGVGQELDATSREVRQAVDAFV